jgi:sugar/nucleoside kinase (ribokinase family)
VVVATEPVADTVGVGDGAVTAGVHEVTATATVTTCARYLKDR